MSTVRPHVLAVALAAASLAAAVPAFPQGAAVVRGAASVRGVTTTQAGTVFLPGVVVVLSAPGRQPITATSDDTGHFSVAGVPPGDYEVTAALSGFDTAKQQVRVQAGSVLDVALDLAVAKLSESVDVVERAPVAAAGAATQTISGNAINQAPLKGDNYQALLPMLPGVVRGSDGRIRVAGGDPTQSGLQVSSASVTDPSTGDFAFDLPGDAVESVQVLENPYSAEYGRFSSGVTQIQTRKGGDRWQVIPNSFLPRMQWENGAVKGIASFTPRLSIGGPLVANKLFLSENVQYRLVRSDVRSLPGDPSSEVRSFDSYTRLDAVLSPRHTLTTAVAFYPRTIEGLGLNTFTPLSATPTFHQSGYNVGASERSILSSKALVETTVNVKQYDVSIVGQGDGPMALTVGRTSGNYFNQQARNTRSLQAVSVLTATPSADHVVKAGVDMLAASYDGTSSSLPVEIRRADTSLAERITFGDPTAQHVAGADLSAFVQDQWQATHRLQVEAGFRMDRDAVLGRFNPSPRSGVTLALNESATAMLHGGFGLFYQRTPLSVGAFSSMEPRTITFYQADGVTPEAPAITFLNTPQALETPYAVVGNIEYDQRVNSRLLFKVNVMRRQGRHEFIVNPAGDTPDLVLSSTGRSDHWEGEVTARFTPKDRTDLVLSYVRSRSEADLNSFDSYFGNFRNPVIVANQYALTNTDVPHRFLVRGTVGLPKRLDVTPVLEIRSGFPYSVVDELQQVVGVRNAGGRFPTLATLDLAVNRPMKIRGVKTHVGFKVYNLLNTFNPRDVMTNVASPVFGYFFNPIPRTVGLSFWIDR
ncbi:MAG: TonB-dependent receptor [Bacteroidales bacterium]